MTAAVLSVAVLAAMGGLGWAAFERWFGHLSAVERFAYGVPVGMVVASLALVPGAIVTGGLGATLVLVDALACVVLALIIAFGRGALTGELGPRIAHRYRAWRADTTPGGTGPPPASFPGALASALRPSVRRHVRWLPVIVIVAIAIHGAYYWPGALSYRPDGLWAGHVNVWGDYTIHLGNVSSFAYGDNFPPQHPRFAGYPFAYHWLVDLTAAALVPLGLDPAGALELHSYLLTIVAAIALYAFARRLTGSELAGTLALVLFLLGGNLAWLVPVDRALRLGIGTAIDQGIWDYQWKTNLDFWWVNMFWGFWMSQRAFLYGMPMAFAILRTLTVATESPSAGRLWILAGIVGGLLPFAHLATLLALAIAVPVLFLLQPRPGWILFGIVWVAVALPQLLYQQGSGEPGALSYARVLVGWMAGTDGGLGAWLVFWLRNVGLFLPLVIVGFVWRATLARRTWRFLLAFMPLFVIGNLVVLQPWDWDNQKWLVYWFLASAIVVAAVLARVWREQRSIVIRAAVLVAIATMTLSGVFETVNQALGHSTYRMLDAEQVQLAAEIRASTPPRAVFLTGMFHHDAVSVLSGRTLYVGSSDWLGTEGVPFQGRAAEALRILTWQDDAPELIARAGIDDVVIGPYERDQLGANEDAFRARYPVVIDTGDYQVFAVGPGA